MIRIVLLLCVAAAFAFAAQGTVIEAGRGALWQVVRTCVVNHVLTGSAFPCLEVNVSDGDERGYVVLRPPLRELDLILSPTSKIVGVEDPSLQTLEAENYFEDAWNARTFLRGAPEKPLARDNVVLAVNSRSSRTQDQLHIHIGCLSPTAKHLLQVLAPGLLETRWVPVGRPFHGLEFWARLIVQETLDGVNPFRLAVEAWPKQPADGSQLTIGVAGITLTDGREGFVLLASYANPFGQFSEEDFLDYSKLRCQRG